MDITFGDFLRALITSDFDIHPGDDLGLRDAFMQAFRIRGIVPEGATSFTDTAIAWPPAHDLPDIPGLAFGDPNGLTEAETDRVAAVLARYFADPAVMQAYAAQDLLDPDQPVQTPSFHPVFRIGEDGAVRTEMVIEAIQSARGHFAPDDPDLGSFPFRGGVTLIVGKPPMEQARALHHQHVDMPPRGIVRYAIAKPLHGQAGVARQARQRALHRQPLCVFVRQRTHLQRLGLVEGNDPDRFNVDFAMTHAGA
jgi:hypothetical protein